MATTYGEAHRAAAKSPAVGEILKNIAAIIKAEREGRRWTMKGLAAQAGVGKATVWRIENPDGRFPRPLTIRRLAKALDIDPYWIIRP